MSGNWADYKDPFYWNVVKIMMILLVVGIIGMLIWPSSNIPFAIASASGLTGIMALIIGVDVARGRAKEAKQK